MRGDCGRSAATNLGPKNTPGDLKIFPNFIQGVPDESCFAASDCFGAGVCAWAAAYDRWSVWRGGSGGATGCGYGDEGQPVCSDGSDAELLGLLLRVWVDDNGELPGADVRVLAARDDREDRS